MLALQLMYVEIHKMWENVFSIDQNTEIHLFAVLCDKGKQFQL